MPWRKLISDALAVRTEAASEEETGLGGRFGIQLALLPDVRSVIADQGRERCRRSGRRADGLQRGGRSRGRRRAEVRIQLTRPEGRPREQGHRQARYGSNHGCLLSSVWI